MSTTFSRPGRFVGKNVLITGGSSGIGKATAEQIIAEGGRVLVTGTNAEKLDAVKAELPDVLTLKNDAGDPTAAERLGELVKAEFGELDAAFLNAGYAAFVPHSDVTAADFDRQFGVNVRGPILQAKAISPLLREGGSIVINASESTLISGFGNPAANGGADGIALISTVSQSTGDAGYCGWMNCVWVVFTKLLPAAQRSDR